MFKTCWTRHIIQYTCTNPALSRIPMPLPNGTFMFVKCSGMTPLLDAC